MTMSPTQIPRVVSSSVGATHRRRAWIGALTMALLFHVGMWWMPVAMPAMAVMKPRVVRVLLQRTPPKPRPRIRPKPRKRVIKPRRRRRVRRKRRRWRRKRPRRRRIRRRKRPSKRVIKKMRPRAKPRRVIAKATKRPAPLPPQPKTKQVVPVQRVAPVVPKPAPVEFDVRAYGQGVYRAIQQQKRYPLMAYRMRFEGLVIVVIKINRNGRLLGEPKVVRSSGHGILDREAIRMAKAAPIPPFPRGSRKPYVKFSYPVRFRIAD